MTSFGVFQLRSIAFVAVAFLIACFLPEAAHAGGSWGSSTGGFSSSGGSSGGGLLGGRRPIRNLLGRIGSRFSGSAANGSSGGSMGSSGGRQGLFSGRLRNRFSGGSSGGYVSYGSGGSTGYASSGSGYGSSGGGLTGLAPIGVASSYGSVGSSALPAYASPLISAPIETSYSVPQYMGYDISTQNVQPYLGDYMMEQSYPVGDYGFQSGYPIQDATGSMGYPGQMNGIPMNGIGTPMNGPVIDGAIPDGGSINDMLDGGLPPYYGPDEQTPSTDPGVDDGSTSIQTPAADAAVLNVLLPADAQVFINDRPTTTPGRKRSFVSKSLPVGQDSQYEVTAILKRDGREIKRTELVSIRPGLERTVKFNFDQTVTTLALNVPADARVKLTGQETRSTGQTRYFTTKQLDEGKVWDDYTITVEYELDGKQQVEERTLDLVAGQTHVLTVGVRQTGVAAR